MAARNWAAAVDTDGIAAASGDEARKAYRNLAGELWQRTYAIPLYRLWARLFRRWVPSPREIQLAAQGLVGLSNSTFGDRTRGEHADWVRTGLRLWRHE